MAAEPAQAPRLADPPSARAFVQGLLATFRDV